MPSIKLVSECNDFLKDCGFPYAICGGYALELFLNKKIRTHGDIDITVFEENKADIIRFIMDNNWNVYQYLPGGIPGVSGSLRLVLTEDDNEVLSPNLLVALKPGCSLFKIDPKPGEDNIFNHKILSDKQMNFDFMEIIFNNQKDDKFVFWPFTSRGKNITRELNKAVMYNESIPYLSPEVLLFIMAPPEYFDSDYHRDKNCIDFESVMPYLPDERREWLINALEKVYQDGHRWLEPLRGYTQGSR